MKDCQRLFDDASDSFADFALLYCQSQKILESNLPMDESLSAASVHLYEMHRLVEDIMLSDYWMQHSVGIITEQSELMGKIVGIHK